MPPSEVSPGAGPGATVSPTAGSQGAPSPAASPTAPTVTPASSGAPTASPSVTGPTGTPNPATATTPPAVPSTDPNAPNLEVLRQSHETLRSLGDINSVRSGTEMYTRVWAEAQQLANLLNYTPESLQAAFKADPITTMQTLRAEATQHRQSPQFQETERIREMVRRETQPLTEHIARQQADRHNATIDSEFSKMFDANEAFKSRNGISAPAEVRDSIRDKFIETLKWNEGTLKEVVQGKLSGLQRIFDEVVEFQLKAWNGYNSWGQPVSGTTGAPVTTAAPVRGADGRFLPPTTPSNKFVGTLDDIVEGNDKANVLPSMRGFK